MVNLIKSKKVENSGAYYANQITQEGKSERKNYNLIVVLGVVLVLSLIIFLVYQKSVVSQPDAADLVFNTKPALKEPAPVGSSSLPYNPSFDDSDPFGLGSSTLNLKAEELSFGLFYDAEPREFPALLKPYSLPLNIKTDVRNYFTMARTFDLDPIIKDLNAQGFAIVDHGFFTNKENFFDIYRYFLSQEAPLYFSADFVLYNYQKTLNDVYKEIEENIFYENLWDINYYLYKLALTRYMETYSELGDVNDVVLEGERLELVFFAIALKLLEADESQINRRANFTDPNKFTPQEHEQFSINIPDIIADDVGKEVKLIKSADSKQKSPALLYDRDYKAFKVPDNYKRNAKLKNYFLARQWFNSAFPLFYQGERCPDCLLDENDWLINMLAASLIAEDINSNQEIKNKWAEIYKFISYFSGLRQDLTYLHYIDAFNSVFGPNYELSQIFSDDNPDRNEAIRELTRYLLAIEFDPVNGGINRQSDEINPRIGMKILQDNYWPNQYLFSRITGPELLFDKPQDYDAKLITACGNDKHRCRGTAYDILDMVFPQADPGPYLSVNRSYIGWEDRISQVRKDLKDFDNFAWNDNIYWTTLDYLRYYLDYDPEGLPAYMRGNEWKRGKVWETAAAAWVNMQLEDDELINYFEAQDNNNFESYKECDLFNYLEPVPSLYHDLAVRSEMLAKMIYMLKIPKKTNAASLELKDLKEDLEILRDISEKELSGGQINGDECSFLNSMAMQYFVERQSGKSIFVDFPEKDLALRISGMNIIVAINEINGDKVLNFGPIFKFKEELR